jgi:hypothetical protein
MSLKYLKYIVLFISLKCEALPKNLPNAGPRQNLPDTLEKIKEFDFSNAIEGGKSIIYIKPDSIFLTVEKGQPLKKFKLSNADWKNLINAVSGCKLIDLFKLPLEKGKKYQDCDNNQSITIISDKSKYSSGAICDFDDYYNYYQYKKLIKLTKVMDGIKKKYK